MATVAVTGAEGFIGSHLVERLVQRGDRVRAMVLYNSFNSWGWLEALAPDVLANVEVHPGDLRDVGSVRHVIGDAEIVYHLGALIAIPYSYESPRSYFETNVLGTLNVLEVSRALGLRRVVHTSTSEVYGTAVATPIDENHPLQAQSPYAASKIGADKVAESYYRSFDIPVVTLRPFNTYGPRQSARAVIPTILTQLAAGAERIILGDLRPTRDFTFVTDTADAFVAVGTADERAVVGRVFNVGTGSEISIGDLARTACRSMGSRAEIVRDPVRLRPPNSEVLRLVCDSRRLQETTGWHPAVALEAGLAKTAAWFGEPTNLARYKQALYNR